MRKALLLLVSLLAVSPAFAAGSADLEVTSVTTDAQSVFTGGRMAITIRIINRGPDNAGPVNLNLTTSYPQELLIVSYTAPLGWSCSPRLSAAWGCGIEAFPTGGEVQFQLNVRVPARVKEGTPFEVGAFIAAESDVSRDPDTADNSSSTAIALEPASTRAALSIRGTPFANPAREATSTSVTLDVRNAGPNVAQNLILTIDTSLYADPTIIPISTIAHGWSCSTIFPTKMACTRPTLAPSEPSLIELSFTTPPRDGQMSIGTHLYAENNHEEPADNAWDMTLWIGNAEEWRRILIPFTATDIHGFGGSLWKTKISMLAMADVELQPNNCQKPLQEVCFGTPARRSLDFREFGYLWSDFGHEARAQFVYVHRDQESSVRMNARVYDVSREEETAGSEMPIVRERELTTDTISLLDIPLAAQYRHTLRIYDGDGRDGAKVAVEIFADDEEEPRLSYIQTLATPKPEHFVTSSQLPAFPAYAELALGSLLELDGIESLRIELRPVDADLRIWGLVSITNNNTHHVTMVTPQ